MTTKEFHHKNPDGFIDVETETESYGRAYLVEGKKYPSITTILQLLSKEFIDAWKEKVGEEVASKISKKATDKGTGVHQLCEDYLNNVLTDISKYPIIEQESFSKIKKVLDDHVDNIFLQEKALYSHKYECAGRVDLIAEYNGKLSIIDFKTSTKPKSVDMILAYFIQASFYALCLYEMTGILIEQIVIIIAVEFDSPQVFVEHPKKYFNEFLKVRNDFREKEGV